MSFRSSTSGGFGSLPSVIVPVNDKRTPGISTFCFDGPIVGVDVGSGDASRTIYVHEYAVKTRSAFFARALKPEWQKNKEQHKVDLSEHDPEVFLLYMNLVYKNELATLNHSEEWLRLSQLYVLAEELQDTRSKNDIVDAMHAMFTQFCQKNFSGLDMTPSSCAKAIKILYDGTPETSKARQLVVDFYADFGQESWLKNNSKELPLEFTHEVAIAIMKTRPPKTYGGFGLSSYQKPQSVYHENETDVAGLKKQDAASDKLRQMLSGPYST